MCDNDTVVYPITGSTTNDSKVCTQQEYGTLTTLVMYFIEMIFICWLHNLVTLPLGYTADVPHEATSIMLNMHKPCHQKVTIFTATKIDQLTAVCSFNMSVCLQSW